MGGNAPNGGRPQGDLDNADKTIALNPTAIGHETYVMRGWSAQSMPHIFINTQAQERSHPACYAITGMKTFRQNIG